MHLERELQPGSGTFLRRRGGQSTCGCDRVQCRRRLVIGDITWNPETSNFGAVGGDAREKRIRSAGSLAAAPNFDRVSDACFRQQTPCCRLRHPGGSHLRHRCSVFRLFQHERDLRLHELRRLHGILLVPEPGIISRIFQPTSA